MSRSIHALFRLRHGEAKDLLVVPQPFDAGASGPVTTNNPDLFDGDNLNQTNLSRGGLDLWGGAITFAASEQFRTEASSARWLQLLARDSFSGYRGEKFLEIAWRNPPLHAHNQSLYEFGHEHLLPGFASELGFFLGAQEARQPFAEFEHLYNRSTISAHLVGIERLANKQFRLSLQRSGENLQIYSTQVAFASGSLGNARLVSQISGSDSFSIGNHVSWVVGRGVVSQIASSQVRRKSEGNRTFVLYNHRLPNGVASGASVRFRRVPATNSSLRSGIARPFGSRSRLDFEILGMLEVPKSMASLRVAANGSPQQLTLTSANPQHLHDLAQQIGCEVASSLRMSKHIFEFSAESKIMFRDASHYFGTVPIENGTSRVSDSLELEGCDGVFVVGSSVFDSGGSGHPTLLAMQTALLRDW